MLNLIDFTLDHRARQILESPLLRKRAQRMHDHYMQVRGEIKELGYNPFKADKKSAVYQAFRIDSRNHEGHASELNISDTPSGYWSSEAWMLNLQRAFFGKRVRIATEHPRTKRCISEFLLAEHEHDLTVEQLLAVWTNYAITVQTTNEENQALARGAQKIQHFFDDWIKDTYPQHNIQLIYKPTIHSLEDKFRWYHELIKHCDLRGIAVEPTEKTLSTITRYRERKQEEAERASKKLERERKRQLREQNKLANKLAKVRKKAK